MLEGRSIADQPRGKFPKAAQLMDAAEDDVLAFMAFPAAHRTKLHSTHPLERLDEEVGRRTDVVGIFPVEASIRGLVGAVLMEQNDDWIQSKRCLTLETMAEVSPCAYRASQSDAGMVYLVLGIPVHASPKP